MPTDEPLWVFSILARRVRRAKLDTAYAPGLVQAASKEEAEAKAMRIARKLWGQDWRLSATASPAQVIDPDGELRRVDGPTIVGAGG